MSYLSPRAAGTTSESVANITAGGATSAAGSAAAPVGRISPGSVAKIDQHGIGDDSRCGASRYAVPADVWGDIAPYDGAATPESIDSMRARAPASSTGPLTICWITPFPSRKSWVGSAKTLYSRRT